MTEHHVSKASFKNPVVRGWGQGGEMTQALYAHMNNKTIKKKSSCQSSRWQQIQGLSHIIPPEGVKGEVLWLQHL
jgi:hypothetical protein